jgi:DNA-directed RNA polymerase specialized sigma subunit
MKNGVKSLYLNYNQWNSIQKILQHTKTTPEIRNLVNKILFKAYEKFAINQAFTFKKYHKQKCFNVNIEDLILSSKLGLFRSIKKYKGTTNFENYSRKYIQGELYKCLTDFHEINNIPKSIRRKKKTNLSFLERRK